MDEQPHIEEIHETGMPVYIRELIDAIGAHQDLADTIAQHPAEDEATIEAAPEAVGTVFSTAVNPAVAVVADVVASTEQSKMEPLEPSTSSISSELLQPVPSGYVVAMTEPSKLLEPVPSGSDIQLRPSASTVADVVDTKADPATTVSTCEVKRVAMTEVFDCLIQTKPGTILRFGQDFAQSSTHSDAQQDIGTNIVTIEDKTTENVARNTAYYNIVDSVLTYDYTQQHCDKLPIILEYGGSTLKVIPDPYPMILVQPTCISYSQVLDQNWKLNAVEKTSVNSPCSIVPQSAFTFNLFISGQPAILGLKYGKIRELLARLQRKNAVLTVTAVIRTNTCVRVCVICFNDCFPPMFS